MVQIYDKLEREQRERVKEYFVVFPKAEETIEDLKKSETGKTKNKSKLLKLAKQHQNKINIVKMKNKIDASIYRGGIYPR
ncbi:MAG: hypothetical protein ACXADU_04450 [Promethearchaeota archaeon]|jgi:hypothetical protein